MEGWGSTEYILLGFYEEVYNNRTGERLTLIEEESWQISYQKQTNHYMCKQLYSGDYLVMKKTKRIESFIEIWIHDKKHKRNGPNSTCLKIKLCIGDKFYSECTNLHSCSSIKILYIGPQYARMLKRLV